MERQKRIFSLNLIAYIWMVTDLQPEMRLADDGLFYGQFIECNAVSESIKRWRKKDLQVEIHTYLAYFKKVKELTRALRGDN